MHNRILPAPNNLSRRSGLHHLFSFLLLHSLLPPKRKQKTSSKRLSAIAEKIAGEGRSVRVIN